MAQPSSGGIKIESRKDLEAWLQDKPHAVAQAITTRAALRVLPLICGDSVEPIRGGYPKSGLLFGAFRCLFLPSVTMLGDVTESIKKAAHSAAAASIQAPAFSNTPDAAAAAARSAANSLASYVSCASNATYNSYYAVTDPADRISILAAVEVDCRQFDAGKSVADVMRSPIWSKPTPDWVRAAWRATTGNKSLRIARFAPWFKWYEGIAGLYDGSTCDIFGPDLSLKIALQPDDWWKRGVEAVNADVIRWLAEKEG